MGENKNLMRENKIFMREIIEVFVSNTLTFMVFSKM